MKISKTIMLTGGIWVLVTAGLLIGITVNNARPIAQLEREIDDLSRSNKQLHESIKLLSLEVAAGEADDPFFWERAARREFGWVRPGEVPIRGLEIPDSPRIPAIPNP